MNSVSVQPYEDSPAARTALAAFLGRVFAGAADAGGWAARFVHWWDDNPFAGLTRERGWVLLDRAGDVAGFLGLIPACYAVNGEPTPALIPTTWVVDPAHRESALMLGRRLQEMEGSALIVSTTGRRDFQERLVRRGWVLNADAVRQFVPCGLAARWLLGPGQPLPEGRRVTTNVDEVRSLERPFQTGHGIEKWLTPEYLRWYRKSPAREHRFAGVMDEEGRVTSFMMLAPAPVLSVLSAWSVVDWFTTAPGNAEISALLATVAARPEAAATNGQHKRRPFFLRLTAVTGDDTWSGVRGLWRAPVAWNHFHRAPDAWQSLPKRCVPAEGDLGL